MGWGRERGEYSAKEAGFYFVNEGEYLKCFKDVKNTRFVFEKVSSSGEHSMMAGFVQGLGWMGPGLSHG